MYDGSEQKTQKNIDDAGGRQSLTRHSFCMRWNLLRTRYSWMAKLAIRYTSHTMTACRIIEYIEVTAI